MGRLTQADIDGIVEAVWKKSINDMPSAGIGEWLSKKLLTIAKFLGLKK